MKRFLLLGLALSALLQGCVVRAPVYAGPRCGGGPAVWVREHYDRRGVWHPGHWRCPEVIEVY